MQLEVSKFKPATNHTLLRFVKPEWLLSENTAKTDRYDRHVNPVQNAAVLFRHNYIFSWWCAGELQWVWNVTGRPCLSQSHATKAIRRHYSLESQSNKSIAMLHTNLPPIIDTTNRQRKQITHNLLTCTSHMRSIFAGSDANIFWQNNCRYCWLIVSGRNEWHQSENERLIYGIIEPPDGRFVCCVTFGAAWRL